MNTKTAVITILDDPILLEAARTYYRSVFDERIFNNDNRGDEMHDMIFSDFWSRELDRLSSINYNDIYKDPKEFFMSMVDADADWDTQWSISE